jgi:hypothetical protein
MSVDFARLEAGSEAQFPTEEVVGQVVALYDRHAGLVTAPGEDMGWVGLLSYFASATGRVAIPRQGLFGFVEALEYKPSLAEGLHFIDGRAMGYTSGVVISLEQIAADFPMHEEFADYAEFVLPRVRAEYERVRSMNHVKEARRLLEFLAVVEPSLERSVQLLRLILELDETAAEAAPMAVILSRRNPHDRALLQLKARVLERRRHCAAEAEREGRSDDASRAWWDVHHLDPGDEEADAHMRRPPHQPEG